jgi:hypothetical protein
MKQWLMYLICIGPPSLDEPIDQVNEMRNVEEEAYEGMLFLENDGHYL